jgi:hypothetical protein
MMSETSSAWPFATILLVSTPLAKVIFTFCPVFASKFATIFCVGARIGPTASRLISLWARALNQPLNTIAITNIAAEETFLMFFMDGSERIHWLRL